ncbi:30S ribosomal protein S14, partial [Plasmodium falciparum Dd2]
EDITPSWVDADIKQDLLYKKPFGGRDLSKQVGNIISNSFEGYKINKRTMNIYIYI